MPLTKRLRLIALAAALGVGAAPALTQEVNPGAYLAGRQAAINFDFDAAAQYFSKALARDTDNPILLELTNSSYVGVGKIDLAATIARRIQQIGVESQLANMVLLGESAKSAKWDNVLTDLDAGQTVGPLFDGLMRAWARVGAGDMQEALSEFDQVSQAEEVRAFGEHHRALALASTGAFAAADKALADPDLRLSRRGLIARAQILSQLGRQDEAVKILREVFGTDIDRPLENLITALEAGQVVPFDITPDATAGVAEVYFTIAGALAGDSNKAYTLVYSRMAEYLRPDHIEAILLSAGLLEDLGRYDLAIENYGRIPRDNPASDAAQLGRAEALRRSGKVEAAIEALEQLARARPDVPLVHITLGDSLRELDRLEEASKAYERALSLIDEPRQAHWIVFFTRGITYERTDRWPEAEADFLKALELKPDQPQVLNYLGYSYVEKQQNLDEALDMIERAVAAQPDSGYITDSLGWVFYRLGRYPEAVAPMERAVELTPVDPVINDHLGDVYWAVGRKLEAQFQWKRALSFIDPKDTDGEADPVRIKRKLEVGLDVVLQEEGLPPLTVANDG